MEEKSGMMGMTVNDVTKQLFIYFIYLFLQ